MVIFLGYTIFVHPFTSHVKLNDKQIIVLLHAFHAVSNCVLPVVHY